MKAADLDHWKHTWHILYSRQHGLCYYCSKPMMELAHRIPQGRAKRLYGARVAHHVLNLEGTCHACNSKAMIGIKGEIEKALVERIREELK